MNVPVNRDFSTNEAEFKVGEWAMRKCAKCGKVMHRRHSEPADSYAKRAYCSRTCKATAVEARQVVMYCECGAQATKVAKFIQLTSQGHFIRGELAVCERCATMMVEDDNSVIVRQLGENASALEVARVAG